MALLICALICLGFVHQAAARDPTNLVECRSTLAPMIEARCKTLFAEAGQQSACLQQVSSQVNQTCDQFFGDGQDFCAVCTSSCTQNFPAGNAKRRECLSMCLSQDRCK